MLSSTDKGQKIAKRRYEMSLIESLIRLELNKGASYSACILDANQKKICPVNPNLTPRFQKAITGVTCTTAPCGIVSTLSAVASATQPQTHVAIAYNGNDAKIKKIEFDVDVPKEALNAQTGICGSDKDGDGIIDGYLYKGVLADGTDDCRGLPSCPVGTYFDGIKANGTANCKNITTGMTNEGSGVFSLKCSTNTYLKSVAFDPSKSQPVSISCEPRIDPCTVASANCPTL